MVELFGQVESSESIDGEVEMVFRIPAFSRRIARRRAMVNGQVKGIEDAEITSVEAIDQGEIPGQNIFNVTVRGGR